MITRLSVAPSFVAISLGCVVSTAAAENTEPKQVYNLPRGDAATTLRQFASSSGRQIFFMMDKVQGEQTNALAGEFSPGEALIRMLAGTSLVAHRDERTGGFVVSRRPAPVSREEVESNSQQPSKPKAMLIRHKLAAMFYAALASVAIAQQPSSPPADEDKVVELSPFVVTTNRDTGYIATNTLAGSRMNSLLSETPATIQVLTKDFLLDVGALNVSQAMEYAVAGGNDIGPGNVGGTTGNGLIENDFNFRIRGYHNVVQTRDYFPTVLDGDTFNLERIDISRGPNSILFGVGGAGGIVNYTAKQAELGRDITQGLFRVGSYDSYREAIDVNRVLFKGKVAMRLNLMNQDADGYQDFVTDNQERGALAIAVRPTETTTIRLSSEIGKLHQNRARPWLPFDQISSWSTNGSYVAPYGSPEYPLSLSDTVYTQWSGLIGGINTPSNPFRSAGYITSVTPGFTDGPLQGKVLGASAQDWWGNGFYRSSFGGGAAGFNTPTNMPDGSVPRTLNISGPGTFVEKTYSTYGITVEQKLGRNFYVQGVVNHSDMRQHNQQAMGFANIALLKDATSTLPTFNTDRSYDGTMTISSTADQPLNGYQGPQGSIAFNNIIANPYTSQYMVTYTPAYTDSKNVNDDYRLQATYSLDLGKWGGKHDILGFASRSEATQEAQSYQEVNVDPHRPQGANDGWIFAQQNFSGRVTHINPFSGSLAERGVPDPWKTPLANGVLWGDPAHGFIDGWARSNWGKTKRKIDTAAVAVQSKFLNDALVTTAGLRRDKLEITNFDGNRLTATGEAIAPTPSASGAVEQSATTYTYGAVYKLPYLKGVSLVANKSTNFQDQPGEVLFGDADHQSAIGPIKGSGEDVGLKFDFLGGRVSASVDYFRVNQSNAASGFDGNIYSYITAIWTTIANNGPVGTAVDKHRAGGSDTSSQRSQGAELEVTANLTKNWRLSFNVSKDTNVVSALDTHVQAYIDAHLAEWQSKSSLPYNTQQPPGVLGNNTVGALLGGLSNLIAVDKLREGQIETNQRRWNGNVFTAYTIDHGWLKHLTVGAGANYRGAQILGINPNTHEQYSGSDYYVANGMLAYQFKLQKMGVKIQFNVDNLFDYTKEQTLASAWNSTTNSFDKYHYYILPRTYSLTTTIDF